MANNNDNPNAIPVPPQYKVLTLSFNQDSTSLAMGTPNNYSLFTIFPDNKIDEIHNCVYSDTCVIERLFSSSLIAIVSNQAPRKLKVCHFTRGAEILSYSFTNTIIAIKLNRLRLVVCLEESIYIHDMRDMKLLHTIRETPPNPDGLCALSSNNETPYLAYPGSALTGEIQIFDTTSLKPGIIIGAHESPIAAVAFDMTGTRIATASNKGTVIRVHSVVDGSRLFEFRRGVRRVATIYSLAFSPDSKYLAASSNTETIHIFRLVHQNETPQEEPATLMGTFTRMLGGMAYYLPRRTSEALAQDRAFATVHLQTAGTKTLVAMNTDSTNTLKLFVAGYDGVVSVYDVNTQDGGECKQTSQNLLFNVSKTPTNLQAILTNDRQQSIDGSKQSNSSDGSKQSNSSTNRVRSESQSTAHSVKLTNEKQTDDQHYVTTVDERIFPPLPSLP